MSWAYWAPKTTTTVSKDRSAAPTCSGTAGSAMTGAGLTAHADALRPLQALALGLQRGGDHHLGLLELLDGLVAAGGHRGSQRTEQVEAAVVLVGRPDQD